MNQSANSDQNDDLRHQAYRKSTNVVFLDPDMARVFKDSASVNRALRLLLKLAKEQAATEE